MRALVWIKASKADSSVNTDDWWERPSTCLYVGSLGLTHWPSARVEAARFIVNVSLMGEAKRCGGILCSNDRIIRALFFGPLHVSGRDYTELVTMKIAVDIFIEAGWVGVTELVLESNSRVVLNWIENPIARPRVWWETFLELDRAARLIGKLNFCHAERADNSMAALLAKEGFCLVEKEMDSEMMEIDCFFNSGDFEEIKLISMAILLVKEGANHTKIYKAWWFSEGSIGLIMQELTPQIQSTPGGKSEEVKCMGSGEPGEVHWSGNQLWEDVAGVPLRVESKLEESAKVVWVMIVSSLVLEGSKVEVITYKGNRRKVRILEYVIQSILSLKERIVSARTQRKRGIGRLQKVSESLSAVANISMSDIDFVKHHESII
ncbi:hypothetical protein V6N12_024428 [Hibiscus sabdariffa]|uniref:RNase H type-1 domain-containing protein n=1 Tax=Hibiscus sabdariffa TaxID=183260 RepID=A0ABR2G0K0_9ROSI